MRKEFYSKELVKALQTSPYLRNRKVALLNCQAVFIMCHSTLLHTAATKELFGIVANSIRLISPLIPSIETEKVSSD